MGRLFCCVVPMVVTTEGIPWLHVVDPEASTPDEMMASRSMRAHGPDGPHGPILRAPDLEVPDHTFRVGDRTPLAAFAPAVTWALAPDGTVVTGASHEYRFEMRHPDGRFLGELDVPDEVNLRLALPRARGDTVIASTYDEAGTNMVKRYRLVRPGARP